METEPVELEELATRLFLNFLRGMETRWLSGCAKGRRGFLNFLRGMETASFWRGASRENLPKLP